MRITLVDLFRDRDNEAITFYILNPLNYNELLAWALVYLDWDTPRYMHGEFYVRNRLRKNGVGETLFRKVYQYTNNKEKYLLCSSGDKISFNFFVSMMMKGFMFEVEGHYWDKMVEKDEDFLRD